MTDKSDYKRMIAIKAYEMGELCAGHNYKNPFKQNTHEFYAWQTGWISKINKLEIMKNENYCWYSEKQEDLAGYCIYNVNGSQVKVTETISFDLFHSQFKDGYKSNFNDAVFMGLGTFLCRKSYGLLGKPFIYE